MQKMRFSLAPVSLSVSGRLTVLDQVDFAIAPGEAIGIVGPNGAGKTTLLNVLSGSFRPSVGTVHIRGADVTNAGAAERCRLGVARSHQIPRPFGGMTLFENLYVAATNGAGERGEAAYARCTDALDLCGMLPIANRRAETLGLLDRKRLELARAVATDPVVLLLDEIGGGLTDGEAGELLHTIRALKSRGLAIVWIEHIVHVLVQVIDRLVCLDGGRIIADAAPRPCLRTKASLLLIWERASREPARGRATRRPARPSQSGARCRHCTSRKAKSSRWSARMGPAKPRSCVRLPALIIRRAAASFLMAGTSRRCVRTNASRAELRSYREGRRLFAGLTVEENLRVAGDAGRRGRWNLEALLEVFPMLKARLKRRPACCRAASSRRRPSAVP